MEFHLNYNPPVNQTKLSHQEKVLFIGSCFSEHIGDKLINLKFNVDTNPFGIVFNPKSIEKALTRIIDKDHFEELDVFEKEGLWYTLEGHSSISEASSEALLEKLNTSIDLWNHQLATSKFLIITFGSAYAYKHKTQNKIVANCHKLPAGLFDKELLEANAIVESFGQLIKKINKLNPQLCIFFTVSPVKHLRDGVVENSLSKAILIQSVHQIIKQNANCFYFPAYELVNDDLRDYRFYEADMVHPNQQAIDYVWEKFSDCYFNEETKLLNDKLTEIIQASKHRPFNAGSESHLKFKNTFFEKCKELNSKYPTLDLQTELNYFSK